MTQQRNRAMMFALSTEQIEDAVATTPPVDANNTPQFDPDDQGPIDVPIDPDHPETIEGLSLIEYAELTRNNGTDGLGDAPVEGMVAEGFGEHWQNFKNRFEGRMNNEDAYIDTMAKRLKEKLPMIQALNEKEISKIPLSIFANSNWYQLAERKVLRNAGEIIQQLQRLVQVNQAMESDWVPSYAAAVKDMMAILSTGATDVDSAFAKAYVIDATHPSKKVEGLATKPHAVKLRNGETISGKATEAYPGGWFIVAYDMQADEGVAGGSKSRGIDFYIDNNSPPIKKAQLPSATREEMKKIVELGVELCEIMDRYIDKQIAVGMQQLIDKARNFENTHRNWRKYPQEERRKIATLLNVTDNVLMRTWVSADVCDGTRMAVRAFERFVEMSMQRAK